MPMYHLLVADSSATSLARGTTFAARESNRVEMFYEVTEQLHHERELKEDVAAKSSTLIIEDVIHPYKPFPSPSFSGQISKVSSSKSPSKFPEARVDFLGR